MAFDETTVLSGTQLALNYGKVNAMDIEFCDMLITRFDEIADDPGISSVILTGNGRVFSAGIDLKKWLANGPDYVEPFLIKLEQLFEAVFCFSKPVIAVIDGPAIAGGCMLASGCDFRIISPTAKIGILESRLGVPLPMTAIEIMRHVAAPSAFKKIISVGGTFVGQQAVNEGLADVVVESDYGAAVHQAQEELTAIAQATFELTKRQARMPVMRIVQKNKEELFHRFLEIWKSAQTRDAIQAYVEQRLG